MAILNPCCCISLQKGSKIVGVVDIILASIPLITYFTNYMPDAVGGNGNGIADFSTGIWTIFMVFLTADVGLSILLIYASKHRCAKNLKAWFYIRLITTGLMLLLIIIAACFEVPIKFVLYDAFYTIYRLFSLWVVYLFIGEITYEEIFFTKKSSEFAPKHPPIPTISGMNSATILSQWPKEPYENGSSSMQYGAVNSAYVP